LFSEGDKFNVAPNTMVIRIQPDEGVTLVLNSKVPGLETRTQPVKMHFRYAATYGSNTPEAYERLILDAMIGDGTLFIRGDETEASWKLITPILEHWKASGNEGMESYTAGSWGPDASDAMLKDGGNTWRNAG
jgi:glucose-6-phosphate 1-dehydrogenase